MVLLETSTKTTLQGWSEQAVASYVYMPTLVHRRKRCVSEVSRSNVSGIDNMYISMGGVHSLYKPP